MREIKFRAWDSHNKIMINPYCELREMRFWGEDLVNSGFQEPTVIMQYTGLKDRNGKEIYDHDLIVNSSRNKGNAHKVIFTENGYWAGDYGTTYLIGHECYEIEVIGNIYENPNLLQ